MTRWILLAGLSLTLLSLALPLAVRAQPEGIGSATLTWMPPTERVDGSPLTNLDHYNLYWGTDPTFATAEVARIDGDRIEHDFSLTITGDTTVFFALTAVDADGLESDMSNVASATFRVTSQGPPKPPTGLEIQFTFECTDSRDGYICTITQI